MQHWYLSQEQILTAAEPHRYKIVNEGEKTKLLVHNLTEADSGSYYCAAVYPIGTTMGHLELKVSKYIDLSCNPLEEPNTYVRNHKTKVPALYIK